MVTLTFPGNYCFLVFLIKVSMEKAYLVAQNLIQKAENNSLCQTTHLVNHPEKAFKINLSRHSRKQFSVSTGFVSTIKVYQEDTTHKNENLKEKTSTGCFQFSLLKIINLDNSMFAFFHRKLHHNLHL